jgi:hypothetical protein
LSRATAESNCPSSTTTTYDLEDGSPIGAEARLEVPVMHFCCETCHLVLDDYELITQAGLPDSFEFVDENPGAHGATGAAWRAAQAGRASTTRARCATSSA